MDRTGVPPTLLLQLLCSSASLCLYAQASPQISPPSSPVWELQSPSCKCSLRVEPPELVVRFGDPVSVNCSTSQVTYMGWAYVPTPTDAPVVSLLWTEAALRTWSLDPVCFATSEVGQCEIRVPVTVYHPPESVSLTFRNISWPPLESLSGSLVEDFSLPLLEPLEEGQVYCLQCEVEAVAPAQNMTVAFYRGLRELNVTRSSITDKRAVNESFCLEYRVSRKDHGATFWCEARLELGPAGPQPPPVVRSHNITVLVDFTEEQVEAPPTRSSREHAGRDTVSAQSRQGQRWQPGVHGPKGAGHAPGSSTVVLLALLLLHI